MCLLSSAEGGERLWVSAGFEIWDLPWEGPSLHEFKTLDELARKSALSIPRVRPCVPRADSAAF